MKFDKNVKPKQDDTIGWVEIVQIDNKCVDQKFKVKYHFLTFRPTFFQC